MMHKTICHNRSGENHFDDDFEPMQKQDEFANTQPNKIQIISSDTTPDLDGVMDPYDETDELIADAIENFSLDQNSMDEHPSDSSLPVEEKKARPTISKPDSHELFLSRMEEDLLRYISFRVIEEKLYFFNGKAYASITKKKFIKLLRKRLPTQSFQKLKSIYSLNHLFEWLIANPDLEWDLSAISSQFDTYVSFNNCVVDVRTLEKYNHSPNFPLFFWIDADWKSKAESDVFKSLLETMSGGDKKIKMELRETLGYLMLHTNAAKKWFVFGCSRDSGKSVLLEFLNRLFPKYATMHIALQSLSDNFLLGKLSALSLISYGDLSADPVPDKSVGLVKSLTGDKFLTVREIYSEAEDICHHAHLLFCTNEQITIRRNDEAFWKRLKIVPFQFSVSDVDKDPHLIDELWEERNAIVSSCIKACHKLIENSYQFTTSDASHKMWLAWSQNVNQSLQDVIDRLVLFTYDKNDAVSTIELHQSYSKICEKNGFYPVSYQRFIRMVLDYTGCQYAKKRMGNKNPIHCFVGMKLIE